MSTDKTRQKCALAAEKAKREALKSSGLVEPRASAASAPPPRGGGGAKRVVLATMMLMITVVLWLARCEAVLDLLSDLKMPRGLALDLEEQRMYWAEDGTKKIRSATLDGKDLRDVIVKDEVQEAPRDVAIDSKKKKIYWTALCCGLRRADLTGDNEEVSGCR